MNTRATLNTYNYEVLRRVMVLHDGGDDDRRRVEEARRRLLGIGAVRHQVRAHLRQALAACLVNGGATSRPDTVDARTCLHEHAHYLDIVRSHSDGDWHQTLVTCVLLCWQLNAVHRLRCHTKS